MKCHAPAMHDISFITSVVPRQASPDEIVKDHNRASADDKPCWPSRLVSEQLQMLTLNVITY
jgi:hypothetical protein